MRNLARAAATAGIAVALGIVAMPSASAAEHGAGKPAVSNSASSTASSQSPQSSKSSQSAKASADTTAVEKAVASGRPVTVNVYYVMHDGRVVSEQGPGNNAANQVENYAGAVDVQSQNESIKTGDLEAEVEGDQTNSPLTFEVEGSEQDQGAGA